MFGPAEVMVLFTRGPGSQCFWRFNSSGWTGKPGRQEADVDQLVSSSRQFSVSFRVFGISIMPGQQVRGQFTE